MDKATLIAVLGQFGEADAIAEVIHDVLPLRETLPNKRRTEREKIDFDLGNDGVMRVYVEVGFYDDGRPGEVFLKAGKQGTMVRDMFDALATVLSVAMQHGVPLKAFPIKGRDNELTGEGNHLIDTLITKVEELCVPTSTSSGASTSSTSSSTSTSVRDPSSPSS